MDVVFGDSPVARALASRLARENPCTLVGKDASLGSWLWRKGDMATGEGVLQALKGAGRAFVVMEHDLAAPGLFTLLKPATVPRGAVVLPVGAALPEPLQRLPNWSSVQLGPAWGPEDPLVEAWAKAIAAGRRIWVPDLGEIAALSLTDAAEAALAASREPGRAWTYVAPAGATLTELAQSLASGLSKELRMSRAPLGLAAWKAGVPASWIRRWQRPTDATTHTPGWHPPAPIGRVAWLGDPKRWLTAKG